MIPLFSHRVISKSALLAPPSIRGTFIAQNLFSLSWLAAPFLPFCVATKLSTEAAVIVFHLGQLEALQAFPDDTERGGKNRERDKEPRPRLGTENLWPIYHDASVCCSWSEVNLPLHNFAAPIQAQTCLHTGRQYRSPTYSCVLFSSRIARFGLWNATQSYSLRENDETPHVTWDTVHVLTTILTFRTMQSESTLSTWMHQSAKVKFMSWWLNK